MKFNFSKFFKKKGKKFGKPKKTGLLDPIGAWRIIIIVFLSAEIILIALHVYFFHLLRADPGAFAGVGETAVALKIDQKKLTETLSIYETRAGKVEEIKTTKPNISDPSL